MIAAIQDVTDDSANSKRDLVDAFNRIDVDGSGSISKEELRSHVSRHNGLHVSKKDFDVLFGIIDSDKSGKIDLAEYSLFVEQVQKMSGEKKRRKSSLKVSTQKESLSSCDRPKMKKNKKSTSTRSSMLMGTRLQKSFHTKTKLDLDKSLPQATPERPTTLRFFDVEVREYGVSVSDNPGVKSGVALELSWDYNVLERTHLDTFEADRSKLRAKNFRKEKKLTKLEREKILREFGATGKEIQEASKRAASIRNKRKKSISMRQHDKFYEDVENRMSKIKRLIGIGHKPKVKNENADLERLHPTLMAMIDCGNEASQSSNV